jgi:cytochrome c-type biogenesis protein CcmH
MQILMFLLILAGLLIPVFPLLAQTPGQTVTDDEVNVIARDLFCPVCESTPLDVCETQACADWREVIRVKLAEGQSEEQIKGYFAEQYGVRALAEPPAKGFTLLVWLFPIIAVPAAIIIFVFYLRKIRSSAAVSSASIAVDSNLIASQQADSEPDKDPYTERIEKELRDM